MQPERWRVNLPIGAGLAVLLTLFVFWFVPVLTDHYFADAGSQQVSSLTADTVIDRARAIVKDNVSTSYFSTDAQMLVWVNEAHRDVARKTLSLEGTEEITLVDGQEAYTISTTYYGIMGAKHFDSGANKGTTARPYGMTRIERYMTNTKEDLDPPIATKYYEFNGQIYIYGIADSDFAGDTVTVFLAEQPSTLLTSTTLETASLYDDVITWYVVAQWYYRDNRPNDGDRFMARYDRELAALNAIYNLRKRQTDKDFQ